MSDQNTIQFGIGGGVRPSEAYGADYLSEMRRIIAAYTPDKARTVLEWGMGNSTQFFIYTHLTECSARCRNHRWRTSYVIDRASQDADVREKHLQANVSSLPLPT